MRDPDSPLYRQFDLDGCRLQLDQATGLVTVHGVPAELFRLLHAREVVGETARWKQYGAVTFFRERE